MGGEAEGPSEMLVTRNQLVSLETGSGYISSLTYSKSKMFPVLYPAAFQCS